MKLTYRPLTNEEVLRVACEGLVSFRGTPPGSEPLLELLGPHCYRQKVILNLERTDGIDTSGLMWLVRVATKFANGSGRLAVYNFSPNFRNMLDVLGMSGTVVLVATTEQTAIETVARSATPWFRTGTTARGRFRGRSRPRTPTPADRSGGFPSDREDLCRKDPLCPPPIHSPPPPNPRPGRPLRAVREGIPGTIGPHHPHRSPDAGTGPDGPGTDRIRRQTARQRRVPLHQRGPRRSSGAAPRHPAAP